MAKLTLTPVTNLTTLSAVTVINTNSDAIEAALENTLSRDGTTPNQMQADIDMNSHSLNNVAQMDVETLFVDGDRIVGGDAVNASNFATAAQGLLAESAVQPTRQIIAGTGLTGGGDLSANRALALNTASIDSLAKADTAVQPTRLINTGTGLIGGSSLALDMTLALNAASIASLAKADTAVQPARQILAGTGMSGGGDLSADRTLSLSAGSQASLALANSALQAASINSAAAAGQYAEVDWTPVLTFATPGNLAVTYSVQIGKLTRHGRMRFASFQILTTTFTHTTASGNLQVTGLPDTNNANIAVLGSCEWQGITKASYTQVSTSIANNTTIIQFRAFGSAQSAANITFSDMPTGGTIRLIGTIVYFV